MKPVFVDTSALIAIGNRRDAFHWQAVKIRDELKQTGGNLITTNAVLLEFGNAFSVVNLRPAAIKMIEAIRTSGKWECINTDDNLVEKGFQKFKQIRDKDWGLVDCISMIVSKNYKITEIFTTDHHFEQAGFKILLKKNP
jgi:uncharacterized protein